MVNIKKLSLILFAVILISTFCFAAPNSLKINFIDVGQADCILVQTPDGKNMLVDTGNNEDAATIESYLRSAKVNKIDILVGTHPHEDHIGSMDTIIKDFSVGKIYMPKKTTNTKTFRDVLQAVKSKGLQINSPMAGSILTLDPSVKIEVLAPNSANYKDLNDYSIVLRISYGKTSFLLTGDAERESEKEMLAKGYNLQADVLKVGHHGSKSSTSAAFLKAVHPTYAVISVGQNNDYGHPKPETLNRLQKAGVKIYRTDLNGTVVAQSDGKKITIKSSR